MILTLLKKDCQQLFVSPFIWLYLCFFQVITTWIYFIHIDQFLATQTQLIASNALYTVSERIMLPFFKSMGLVCTVLQPFITMSLISKEKQQHTYTLLKSAPISLLQLVSAKLLTSLVIILLMTALINIMVLLLSIGTSINYLLLLSCTLAFIIFNLTIASIGLFLSSLTKQPIVAGISTLGLLLLTLLFGWNTEQSSSLLSILSLHTHYNALLEASIESSDLLYLLFISALMFSWTVFKLSSESWRH